MYIDQRHQPEAVILDCCGRFDETDHDHFVETIEQLHTGGHDHVVVNLTSLYFLDPKVISVLHFAYEYFQDNEGSLSLVSPLSAVRNELNIAHVPETIPTYPTVYDALHRPHINPPKEIPVAAASA
ncbi:STAS domain-containing protein [Nitrospira sp. M1]